MPDEDDPMRKPKPSDEDSLAGLPDFCAVFADHKLAAERKTPQMLMRDWIIRNKEIFRQIPDFSTISETHLVHFNRLKGELTQLFADFRKRLNTIFDQHFYLQAGEVTVKRSAFAAALENGAEAVRVWKLLSSLCNDCEVDELLLCSKDVAAIPILKTAFDDFARGVDPIRSRLGEFYGSQEPIIACLLLEPTEIRVFIRSRRFISACFNAIYCACLSTFETPAHELTPEQQTQKALLLDEGSAAVPQSRFWWHQELEGVKPPVCSSELLLQRLSGDLGEVYLPEYDPLCDARVGLHELAFILSSEMTLNEFKACIVTLAYANELVILIQDQIIRYVTAKIQTPMPFSQHVDKALAQYNLQQIFSWLPHQHRQKILSQCKTELTEIITKTVFTADVVHSIKKGAHDYLRKFGFDFSFRVTEISEPRYLVKIFQVMQEFSEETKEMLFEITDQVLSATRAGWQEKLYGLLERCLTIRKSENAFETLTPLRCYIDPRSKDFKRIDWRLLEELFDTFLKINKENPEVLALQAMCNNCKDKERFLASCNSRFIERLQVLPLLKEALKKLCGEAIRTAKIETLARYPHASQLMDFHQFYLSGEAGEAVECLYKNLFEHKLTPEFFLDIQDIVNALEKRLASYLKQFLQVKTVDEFIEKNNIEITDSLFDSTEKFIAALLGEPYQALFRPYCRGLTAGALTSMQWAVNMSFRLDQIVAKTEKFTALTQKFPGSPESLYPQLDSWLQAISTQCRDLKQGDRRSTEITQLYCKRFDENIIAQLKKLFDILFEHIKQGEIHFKQITVYIRQFLVDLFMLPIPGNPCMLTLATAHEVDRQLDEQREALSSQLCCATQITLPSLIQDDPNDLGRYEVMPTTQGVNISDDLLRQTLRYWYTHRPGVIFSSDGEPLLIQQLLQRVNRDDAAARITEIIHNAVMAPEITLATQLVLHLTRCQEFSTRLPIASIERMLDRFSNSSSPVCPSWSEAQNQYLQDMFHSSRMLRSSVFISLPREVEAIQQFVNKAKTMRACYRSGTEDCFCREEVIVLQAMLQKRNMAETIGTPLPKLAAIDRLYVALAYSIAAAIGQANPWRIFIAEGEVPAATSNKLLHESEHVGNHEPHSPLT